MIEKQIILLRSDKKKRNFGNIFVDIFHFVY